MDSLNLSLVNNDEISIMYDNLDRQPEIPTVINAGDTPDVAIKNNVITQETKIYKRRWYVLAVFSFFAMIQGGLWNTWGPIAASSEEAFGWTDGDIALFSNWGPIAYLISTFPFAWLIDVKGLRRATLIAAFMVAVGSVVRCITDNPDYIKWTVNIGQLFNGLAGPVAMGVPPVLSALWFPANERTTSTSISAILGTIGVGISFKIGPYFVPDKKLDTRNTTFYNASYICNNCIQYNVSNTNERRIQNERKEIMLLMYWECGVAVLSFLLVLLYFPDKPKLPPTLSASVERVDFGQGVKRLLRNVKFWMICLSYGVSLGMLGGWQGVLDVILKPHHISEDEAGWLGFYSLIAGCIVSLIIAKFADIFTKHIRLFLLVLYITAAGCLVWFTLLIQGTIYDSSAQLYSSIILFCMFLGSTTPLYFEMACETTYPVAEGVTNLVLTLINNIGGMIFLAVQMMPQIGTSWENWCLLGAIVSCIPVLFAMKERYNRMEVDETELKNH